MPTEDIFSAAEAEFESMSESELLDKLRKFQEEEAKRRERQKEYNSSPEAQAKRKQYMEERKAKMDPDSPTYDPDFEAKEKARRKEYQAKTKEERKEYNKKRQARFKALLKVAQMKGLIDANGNVVNA